MIRSVILILLFQVLGEALAFALSSPMPGSVLGMLLLVLWLLIRKAPDHALMQFSTGALRHLSLVFIPVTVGIMTQFDLLAREWPAILIAVVGSTLVSIVVTASLVRGLSRKD